MRYTSINYDCDCFHCADKETGKGELPCEYWNHHCELCHSKCICSKKECRDQFDQIGVNY